MISNLCFFAAGLCILGCFCAEARSLRKIIRQVFGITVIRKGEIVAHGRHHVEIELPIEGLDEIVVEFADEPCQAPCDPGDEDELRWSYHREGHEHDHCSLEDISCHYVHPHEKHVLRISWRVSNVRTIVWKAFY